MYSGMVVNHCMGAEGIFRFTGVHHACLQLWYSQPLMRTILLFIAVFGLASAAAVCQQPSPSTPARKKQPETSSTAGARNTTEAELQKTAQATMRWDQASTPGVKAN